MDDLDEEVLDEKRVDELQELDSIIAEAINEQAIENP